MKVSYFLREPQKVRLSLFDSRGSEIRVFIDAQQNRGHNTADLDISGLHDGIYWYRYQAGEKVELKKFIMKQFAVY